MNNQLLLLGVMGALLTGCEDKPAGRPEQQPARVTSQPAAPVAADACADALTVLLAHSSFASPFKPHLGAELEAQNETQLRVRLRVAADGEAGPATIVGWVRLELANRQLLDFTNDPENPVPLTFRRADWDRVVACAQASRTAAVAFADLFPEGAVIPFTPAQLLLPGADSGRQAFRRKLAAYEIQHSTKDSFDPQNLLQLVNHDVFANAEGHIPSSWLAYFIQKYDLPVRDQTAVFEQAIAQEDAGAVAVLLARGYLVSARQLRVAAATQAASDAARERNRHHQGLDEQGNPTFYEDDKSTIRAIVRQLTARYGMATVTDPDGYVNVRQAPGTAAAVVGRAANGDKITVLDNTGKWWHLETRTGTRGFVFANRVTLRQGKK
ncbi:SH3 domain-containing protein [Hymenobacter ruricola]|uniref:SH3 domain-containing protein n=1 Tax=Hymenobacter ruricola TaxID=2791023 RepID=A0ABS0I3G1_9BACT|nr:SH3 domain-containing protein [Hymenobacter ruricola]MBF9221331.1 SH3 domain-containing protein [Hymenobacter ruricola]